MHSNILIWTIVALSVSGVIIRPWRLPEAVWAVGGAISLVLFALLPWHAALTGVTKGLDVYLFLSGMMLLSELARREGVFDWLAVHAIRAAGRSGIRLFALLYLVGTIVTIFLSNDATAVVLTPAVYAASKRAGVRDPLPYLLICAFIANAASFVLPISNPANLVVFGGHMPPLTQWLRLFALPSLASILITFAALFVTQRAKLRGDLIEEPQEEPQLGSAGRVALGGILATAVALIAASSLGWDLGLPTFSCGVIAMVLITFRTGASPISAVREISWAILPLVAGLFVFVEALIRTGVVDILTHQLLAMLQAAPETGAAIAGVIAAITSNLANNLPIGLLSGSLVSAAHVGPTTSASLLVGVDLGPNLSVTGSLATILWLDALRREGVSIGSLHFLSLGAIVMTPALIASLLFVS